MIVDLQETDWNLPKELLSFQNHYSRTTFMEARVRRTVSSTLGASTTTRAGIGGEGLRRGKEQEQYRHQGNKNKKKTLWASYFSLESMVLLICLTASLLFLPLVLPPLPPPPFLLLLLPICILGLLMILAFTPSNVRDFTYTYM